MSALLTVRGLSAAYGRVAALEAIDLSVAPGAVVAVLGANGAGKTTLLRSLSGMLMTRGEVHFEGRRIDGVATEQLVRRGIVHVPEGRGTFERLSVQDNLRLGQLRARTRAAGGIDLEAVFALFPVLRERRRQQAGTLSGGEQQMLAIGRALLLSPRLLLLDEPSFGLAPRVVRNVFDILERVNRELDVTLLLVEQNAGLALEIAGYAYVLDGGRIVLSDDSRALRNDASVRRAYLGF